MIELAIGKTECGRSDRRRGRAAESGLLTLNSEPTLYGSGSYEQCCDVQSSVCGVSGESLWKCVKSVC